MRCCKFLVLTELDLGLIVNNEDVSPINTNDGTGTEVSFASIDEDFK